MEMLLVQITQQVIHQYTATLVALEAEHPIAPQIPDNPITIYCTQYRIALKMASLITLRTAQHETRYKITLSPYTSVTAAAGRQC